MKRRSVARIAFVLVLVAIGVCVFGWYDAYALADKTCLQARTEPDGRKARERLLEIAAQRNAHVIAAADRVTIMFSWMLWDVAACSVVVQGGRITEAASGSVAR